MIEATVPFQLRPNKYVERRLFIEILRMVSRRRDLQSYAYITMGGAFLEDIKLIYGEFGIEKLLSIESNAAQYERQLFNVPLPFLQCHNIDSTTLADGYEDYLLGLENPPNVICWLDYQDAARTSQLADVRVLVPKLKAYDILKVTLNANPSSLDRQLVEPSDADDEPGEPRRLDPGLLWASRLRALAEELGDFFPTATEAKDMRRAALPTVLAKAVMLAVKEGLAESVDAEALGLFAYADGQQMLTVTVILLPTGEREAFLADTGLGTWPFRAPESLDVDEIRVPTLSVRERLELDRHIDDVTMEGLPEELRAFASSLSPASYKRYCRFYPHFARVSL